MDEGTTSTVGGAFSIVAGVLFGASGILFFGFQVGRFDWDSIRSIVQFLEGSSPVGITMWHLVNWGAALASFFAIAGVQALTDRIRGANADLARWAGILAIIGYAMIAVTNVADLNQIHRLSRFYPAIDASARSAIEAIGSGSLDPDLRLRFITLGPWFLISGWLGFLERKLPRPLAYLGMASGSAALLIVVASWADLATLVSLSGAIAVILHPIWLIWTGIVIRTPAATTGRA